MISTIPKKKKQKKKKSKMIVFSMYILNKAGGLVYQRDFSSCRKPQGNQYLTLASTFHGLHAIAKQLSPVNATASKTGIKNLQPSGIELVNMKTTQIICFTSPTLVKFFVLLQAADKKEIERARLGQRIYELYADYVCKNPFYEMDQPIQCELFSIKVDELMKEVMQQK